MINKLFIIFVLFSSLLFSEEQKKIALMFHLDSDLKHEKIWMDWVDLDKYNVYACIWPTLETEWISQFKVITPQDYWFDPLIVRSFLCSKALENSSNYKFIFIDQYQVPTYSADEIYTMLCSTNQTFWDEQILNRKHAEMYVMGKLWYAKEDKDLILKKYDFFPRIIPTK